MWMKVDFFHENLYECILKNVISSDLNLSTSVKIKMAMFMFENVKHMCENFGSNSKRVTLRTILKNLSG